MTELRQKLLDYSKTLESKEQAYRVYYDARAGNGAIYYHASKLRITCNNKAEAIIALVDWMVENQYKYKYDFEEESDEETKEEFDQFVEYDGGIWASDDKDNLEKVIEKYFR